MVDGESHRSEGNLWAPYLLHTHRFGAGDCCAVWLDGSGLSGPGWVAIPEADGSVSLDG